jgi:hypothetical protein
MAEDVEGKSGSSMEETGGRRMTTYNRRGLEHRLALIERRGGDGGLAERVVGAINDGYRLS